MEISNQSTLSVICNYLTYQSMIQHWRPLSSTSISFHDHICIMVCLVRCVHHTTRGSPLDNCLFFLLSNHSTFHKSLGQHQDNCVHLEYFLGYRNTVGTPIASSWWVVCRISYTLKTDWLKITKYWLNITNPEPDWNIWPSQTTLLSNYLLQQ